MTRYQKYGVSISDGQKDNIRRAVKAKVGVSIQLSHKDLQGPDVLALTKTQLNKIAKAHQEGKGVVIKLSKAQVLANTKVEGGFLAALARMALPLLAKTATKAIPAVGKALGIGALTGLANEAVGSLFGGSGFGGEGLYLKKGGCMCQIESDGRGLYLSPTGSTGGAIGGSNPKGNGLYLGPPGNYRRIGRNLSEGRGILLGPNSPFKDIPLLGAIL